MIDPTPPQLDVVRSYDIKKRPFGAYADAFHLLGSALAYSNSERLIRSSKDIAQVLATVGSNHTGITFNPKYGTFNLSSTQEGLIGICQKDNSDQLLRKGNQIVQVTYPLPFIRSEVAAQDPFAVIHHAAFTQGFLRYEMVMCRGLENGIPNRILNFVAERDAKNLTFQIEGQNHRIKRIFTVDNLAVGFVLGQHLMGQLDKSLQYNSFRFDADAIIAAASVK